MRARPRSARARTVGKSRQSITRERARALPVPVYREAANLNIPAKAKLLLGGSADAAVAAGRPRPPRVVAAGHDALQLVDVVDEIALAAVERLLELLELRAPALDAGLAELDIRLELHFPLLEV